MRAIFGLLACSVLISARRPLTQEAAKLVKIPIKTDWSVPYSSLTCILQIGGQNLNVTAGTNSASIMVEGTSIDEEKGYDQNKSPTSKDGSKEILSYKINNAYLAGINDREFTGKGVDDYICPPGKTALCKLKDRLEFFKADNQLRGERLSSMGRLGLDYDPTFTLVSYGFYLKSMG